MDWNKSYTFMDFSLDEVFEVHGLMEELGVPERQIKNDCNWWNLLDCEISQSLFSSMFFLWHDSDYLEDGLPHIKEPSYVYLAYSDSGHYKLGLSKNPKKRIKHFDTIMPIDVKIVHYFQCDNATEAERLLHIGFAKYRAKGEWFNFNMEQVSAIKSVGRFKKGNFYPLYEFCPLMEFWKDSHEFQKNHSEFLKEIGTR